jgi:ATP-dependent Clp protease ATP-binding subunit ClpA
VSTLVVHDNGAPRPDQSSTSLRPELHARITEKIVFSRLRYDVQLDIARLHIARELALLREQGFNLAADESVTSFLIRRGFHQRLGARPRRDAVKKYLRRAVADAMLAEVSLHRGEFVVCGDELLLRPIPELATGYAFAG